MDWGTRLSQRSAANEAIREDIREPRPTPYLVAIKGVHPGLMLAVNAHQLRIGRAPDNSHQLLERNVSRHHAVIDESAGGVVFLTDLGSSNGTYVNGTAIPKYHPVPLRDGDRVRFGPFVVFKFVRLLPDEEQSNRDLFERSIRDRLTGAFNRSFFLEHVESVASSSLDSNQGLAILLVDLDDFKQVNDLNGHAAGDIVLKLAASVLRDGLESQDLLARYGGEEFIAALVRPDLESAISTAELVRERLADNEIPLDSSTIRVTASIGLAFTPFAAGIIACSTLISSADVLLYQAKRLGKNRVIGQRFHTLGPIGSTQSETIRPDLTLGDAQHEDELHGDRLSRFNTRTFDG